MNRRHIIYIKSLSDYAFREIKRLSGTQRSKLSDAELKALKDDGATWEFVGKASLDHLLSVLTKIGKQWDLRIYDREESADQIEFNVVNQFQYPEKRVDVIDAMVRSNVYYMSSMDVMLSGHMCAQNAHSNVFELSSDIKKITQKVRTLKKTRLSHHDQVQDGLDAVDTLNKLLLNQLNSMDWAKQALGLEQNDIRILASLFARRHGAMTMAEIAASTMLDGKKAYLKKNIDKLMAENLIISDAGHGPKTAIKVGNTQVRETAYYMINTAGIDKMMQYRNYLHKITFAA